MADPMQVASPRTRRSVIAAVASPELTRLDLVHPPQEVIERARQDYLDALPIAAAVVCVSEGGDAYIDMANDNFRLLTDWNGHEGNWLSQIGFFEAGTIGEALINFLESEEKAHQFEGHDGKAIAGRYFTVRLARLKGTPLAARRCLISMIDKTAQVETEKSLRAEMLRDSLTGLPNRLAFNEKVEALLESPHFREGSHAVVCIDMTRFSRVNECMGAIAGDELLITFARRLFSALRSGDVLARTGGDEFGILVRLG